MDWRPSIRELLGVVASVVAISQLFISPDELGELVGGFISLRSI